MRERGHDVLAMDQSSELRELEDRELLRLAKEESRILVTSNIGNFMEHITAWARAGESHAGVIMVVYQATQARFGVLIRGIEELLKARRKSSGLTGYGGSGYVNQLYCFTDLNRTHTSELHDRQHAPATTRRSDSKLAWQAEEAVEVRVESVRGSTEQRVLPS